MNPELDSRLVIVHARVLEVLARSINVRSRCPITTIDINTNAQTTKRQHLPCLEDADFATEVHDVPRIVMRHLRRVICGQAFRAPVRVLVRRWRELVWQNPVRRGEAAGTGLGGWLRASLLTGVLRC